MGLDGQKGINRTSSLINQSAFLAGAHIAALGKAIFYSYTWKKAIRAMNGQPSVTKKGVH